MDELEEFYQVKYGTKTMRFSSRDDAELWARKQAVLPFVQRLRNGNGSMDVLCEALLSMRDDIDVAVAGVDEHIKKYIEVK